MIDLILRPIETLANIASLQPLICFPAMIIVLVTTLYLIIQDVSSIVRKKNKTPR